MFSIPETKADSRRLIPIPIRSYEDNERFHHRDLSSLTSERMWSEATLLNAELAAAIYTDRRPVTIHHDSHGNTVTDTQWMRSRLSVLRGEQQRRRQGRAA